MRNCIKNNFNPERSNKFGDGVVLRNNNSGFFSKITKRITRLDTADWFIITIMIFAISLRFYLGPMNTATFIDEYNQIYAAKGINNVGLFSYLQGEAFFTYLRGLHISILIAGLHRIFGFSLFAARLAPFLVGVGILIVLCFLARRFLDKWMTGVFLFVIGIVPWILFSHIYIREYIVIQFLFLAVLLIFLNLRQELLSSSLGSLRKTRTFVLLSLLGACLGIWWITNSKNAYLFLPLIGILIIISYFEFLARKIKEKDYLPRIPTILMIASIIFLVVFTFLFARDIRVYLVGSMMGGWARPPDFYWNFFTESYKPFLILFSVGTIYSLSIKENNKSEIIYVLSAFGGMLLVHQLAPYRQVRFIMYLFPLFFLFVVEGLEPLFVKLKKILKKKILNTTYREFFSVLPIVLIVLFLIISTYPSNFLRTANPSWNRAPNPNDWGKATHYLNKQSSENDMLISLQPQSTELFGLNTDFLLRNGEEKIPIRGGMTGTPNIQSAEELKQVLQSTERAWLILPSRRKGLISKKSWEIVEKKFRFIKKSKNWIGIALYLYEE